jgi:hypothetical protein
MFNLFKKTQPKKATKEYPKVVAEIHNEFMTTGEKLLQEAKKIIANAEIKDVEKVERLKKIGFRQSKQVKDSERAIKAKQDAEKNAKTVEYYSIKYPLYKFITEEAVKNICEKYGLVLGEIRQYKGFVPEKNLAEIERFSVKDEDCVEDYYRSVSLSQVAAMQRQAFSSEMEEYKRQMYGYLDQERKEDKTPPQKMYIREFKICAPLKDMDTSGYTEKEHKLIPDPVVLHPVKDGYLIVTAWGDEASDELVVNEKNN